MITTIQTSDGPITVHLQTVTPPRVVPSAERHKWDRKAAWGESATCTKCGCVKERRKTNPYWTEVFLMPGAAAVTERPACSVPEKQASLNL